MASFVGATPNTSMLELAVVREKVVLLKYQLEQVERSNGELAKELISSKEANQVLGCVGDFMHVF